MKGEFRIKDDEWGMLNEVIHEISNNVYDGKARIDFEKQFYHDFKLTHDKMSDQCLTKNEWFALMVFLQLNPQSPYYHDPLPDVIVRGFFDFMKDKKDPLFPSQKAEDALMSKLFEMTAMEKHVIRYSLLAKMAE